MNRKELEDAGLIYPKMPIIIKANSYLTEKDREEIRKKFEAAAKWPTLILPLGFDVAMRVGRWHDKTDKNYAGDGYTECSVCGDRYSWGAYFEANNFRYCPKCGARMHPDKHLFEEMREEPEADDVDWYKDEYREDPE